MTITLVLLAFSIAVFAAVDAAYRKVGQWINLPDYYFRHTGRNFAVCGVAVYHQAVAAGSYFVSLGGRRLVVVPETRFYSDNPALQSDPRCLGDVGGGTFRDGIRMSRDHEAPLLFVPFVNEKLLSFAEQERVFRKPEQFESWTNVLAEIRQQNQAYDWRKRFGNTQTRAILKMYRIAYGLTMAILFVTALFMGCTKWSAKLDAELITVHSTQPDGTMQEVQSRFGDRHKLVQYADRSAGDMIIIRGKVDEAHVLRGGLKQVCIERSNKQYHCAIADSTRDVSEGKTVHLQKSQLLAWADSKERVYLGREDPYVVITEAEANALVATGKFQIIE